MSYARVCAMIHCQKPFFATHQRGKYCSRSCAQHQKKFQSDASLTQYVLQHVRIPNNPDMCWEWTGPLNDAGYGLACVRARILRAHRLAYEMFVGPIPTGMHILHALQCTTRACINPRHLRPGTNDDNIQDKLKNGMQSHGETHPFARFTANDIRMIRTLYQQGMTFIAIGNAYRTPRNTIYDIVKGNTWKHIDPDTYVPPVITKRTSISAEKADMIRAIRSFYANGMPSPKIARKVGITPQQILNIVHRRSWAHIP